MKKIIVYTITSLHLFLITLVVFHGLDHDKAYAVIEKPLACLTAINYCAWRFAFFTPDVGKSTEVTLTLRNKEGKEKIYSTEDGFDFYTSNWESENRFYGYKVHSARDSMFIDLSARSMCTFVLNEHEDMDYISFSMKGIRYPKMREFTNDSIIKEHEFYSIAFELY